MLLKKIVNKLSPSSFFTDGIYWNEIQHGGVHLEMLLTLYVGHALDVMLPNSAMKSLESFRLKLLKGQSLARVEVCLTIHHSWKKNCGSKVKCLHSGGISSFPPQIPKSRTLISNLADFAKLCNEYAALACYFAHEYSCCSMCASMCRHGKIIIYTYNYFTRSLSAPFFFLWLLSND